MEKKAFLSFAAFFEEAWEFDTEQHAQVHRRMIKHRSFVIELEGGYDVKLARLCI